MSYHEMQNHWFYVNGLFNTCGSILLKDACVECYFRRVSRGLHCFQIPIDRGTSRVSRAVFKSWSHAFKLIVWTNVSGLLFTSNWELTPRKWDAPRNRIQLHKNCYGQHDFGLSSRLSDHNNMFCKWIRVWLTFACRGSRDNNSI